MPGRVESRVCVRGNRVLLEGRVLRGGSPEPMQEVWLIVDGDYALSTVTDPAGRFWFHAWLSGPHVLRAEAYRYWTPRGPVKIQGPEHRVLLPPSLRYAARPRFCDGRCALRWEDVWLDVRAAARELARLTGAPVYLYSSLPSRGYTCHDIDLYVDADLGGEEVERLKHRLSASYCLPIDIASRRQLVERPDWYGPKLARGVRRLG